MRARQCEHDLKLPGSTTQTGCYWVKSTRELKPQLRCKICYNAHMKKIMQDRRDKAKTP